jgi:hypothetical protein
MVDIKRRRIFNALRHLMKKQQETKNICHTPQSSNFASKNQCNYYQAKKKKDVKLKKKRKERIIDHKTQLSPKFEVY